MALLIGSSRVVCVSCGRRLRDGDEEMPPVAVMGACCDQDWRAIERQLQRLLEIDRQYDRAFVMASSR